MLQRLINLYKTYFGTESASRFQQSGTAQSREYFSDGYGVASGKTLDEMDDWELRHISGIPDVIRGSSHADLDDLANQGFRKLSTPFLNYNLFGWPEVTIQALRLVALEKDCTLEKAFNTYKIFIETPRLSKGELNATIWVWQRQNLDDKDDKKDKQKEGVAVEVKEVLKPKVMAAAAGAGRR